MVVVRRIVDDTDVRGSRCSTSNPRVSKNLKTGKVPRANPATYAMEESRRVHRRAEDGPARDDQNCRDAAARRERERVGVRCDAVTAFGSWHPTTNDDLPLAPGGTPPSLRAPPHVSAVADPMPNVLFPHNPPIPLNDRSSYVDAYDSCQTNRTRTNCVAGRVGTGIRGQTGTGRDGSLHTL